MTLLYVHGLPCRRNKSRTCVNGVFRGRGEDPDDEEVSGGLIWKNDDV